MSFQGVLVPVLTPFKANLKPDGEKFAALCRTILDQGAGGLAVFGTTSEANSLSIDERMGLLEILIGSGIPADKLEWIFKRFCQVEPALRRRYEGLGLGLSIAKDLVELHNGRIWAESTVELGSVFTVALPLEPKV